ncbi:Inner membrane ABC transporter permease protein YcjP [compost metagenome]
MLLIFFTMIFDGGLIPNYLLMKSLGLVDSIWVMIIPGAISVWLLIIARAFLDTQPVELEEAAFIDGANDWQTMFRIFLPLSMPILATISVFYAVGIWNAYLGPLIYLQDKYLHPIQVILYQLVLDSRSGNGGGLSLVESEDGILFPRNLQAAVIFCGMFPILLVYPFAQRYFTKGLLVGSIKG